MEFITYEVEGQIGIITINRPKALNALNSAVLDELDKTLDAVDQEAIRCLILTGAGEKSFVAGADIGEMSTLTKAEGEAFGKKGNDVFRKLETFPIPVIAAVNGFALGGGCEISMSCDIRICSENAVFGQPEVGLGIIASTGGIVRLARDINRKDCMELLLTGKKIKAPQAKELGLINYVVPAEEVMDKAIELAEQVLKNAPLALKWTKYLVHAADQMSEEDAMRYCDGAYRFLEKTEDGIEGPLAFTEKRTPNWVGR